MDELPAKKLRAVRQVEILGEGIMLPTACCINRRPAPNASRTAMANDMTQVWEELWNDVQRRRHALESGIRGAVSDERRMALEAAYKAAEKLWWDSVTRFGQ